MASPGSPSNYGHHISAPRARGEALRLRALFAPDALSRVRGVISVLIDIGRLIDKGMAMWLALGLPFWRHA